MPPAIPKPKVAPGGSIPRPQRAPFGTWTSPITSEIVYADVLSFNEVHVNVSSFMHCVLSILKQGQQKTGQTYLVEGRPVENGRCAIVEVTPYRESIDLLPKEFDARSEVHAFGGGAASLGPDGRFVFTDANTGGVFYLSPNGEVANIISRNPKLRYADFDVSPIETSWILAVQRFHREHGQDLIRIVAINTGTKMPKVVVTGADF